MSTMTISLPDQMKQYIDRLVAAEQYSGASEYMRELVRADQKRRATEERIAKLPLEPISPFTDWRKLAQELGKDGARAVLEASLEAAMKEPGEEATPEWWAELREDVRRRVQSGTALPRQHHIEMPTS